jgi:cytochrome c-type biogenesis protein CcmH
MVMPSSVLFSLLASLLAVAILAMVLRPLWREARRPAAVLGVVGLCACLGLYRLVGSPAALETPRAAAPATMDDAVAQLEAALARDPNQVEGWRLLGRAHASRKQWAQSNAAYARAATLAPDKPDVLVEAAEASALADPQRRFDAGAVALLEHALELQPAHQRARWFLGIARRQAGNPAEAASIWEPLLAQVDASTAGALREQINAARKDAGLALLVAPASRALQVRVQLDPDFASRVRLRPDASIFVIARVPDGPPMPIAVEKHAVDELPFTATLDDSDGPMPMRKLSAVQDVELVARLSASGNAMRQEGDLESTPVRVRLPADHTVELTIGAASR